jgi:mRNA interferase MazF
MKRMQLMTGYNRGDVALVNFVFSDETGERRRPAVVVSSEVHHKNRREAIIVAITSRTDRILADDHLIRDWGEAGLLFPSVATGIIRTIKQDMLSRRLGIMSRADMEAMDDNLRVALSLR